MPSAEEGEVNPGALVRDASAGDMRNTRLAFCRTAPDTTRLRCAYCTNAGRVGALGRRFVARFPRCGYVLIDVRYNREPLRPNHRDKGPALTHESGVRFFEKGIRGPVTPLPPGTTRVSIALEDEVFEWFRIKHHAAGAGSFPHLINAALKDYIARQDVRQENTG